MGRESDKGRIFDFVGYALTIVSRGHGSKAGRAGAHFFLTPPFWAFPLFPDSQTARPLVRRPMKLFVVLFLVMLAFCDVIATSETVPFYCKNIETIKDAPRRYHVRQRAVCERCAKFGYIYCGWRLGCQSLSSAANCEVYGHG